MTLDTRFAYTIQCLYVSDKYMYGLCRLLYSYIHGALSLAKYEANGIRLKCISG